MRFTVSSSALNSRLTSLSKVINSKNAMPILDCFLFEVANNSMIITASDGENVMRTSLTLDQCEGDGKFAVSNRTILDAVKELPEQPLTIDVLERLIEKEKPDSILPTLGGQAGLKDQDFQKIIGKCAQIVSDNNSVLTNQLQKLSSS